MLTKKLAEAITEQMVFELYSSYLYLGFAAKLEKLQMPGAAHWMRIQADEELIHANIFYNYLIDQDAEVELDAIKKPSFKADSALKAFEEALAHERLVTARINNLAGLAVKNNDFATLSFLNFFVTEQVQEERSAKAIIDKLKIAGGKDGLLFIDAELAARPAATPPPQQTV